MITSTKVFKQQQTDKVISQKCLRCHDFLTTKFHKNIHNFLKHYADGKKKPFDIKPIEMKQIGSITTYEIIVGKHNQDYNF